MDKRDLSIPKVIGYAFAAELFLILLQFAYMAYYEMSNPGTNLQFDLDYMTHVGFFIFQIAGLFVFTIIAFFIFRSSKEQKFAKVFVFLITGGIFELAFYLIATEFEPAYIYSILDKAVAVAFAGIIYWAAQSKEDFKESPR
jgi:hypothetical protein